jgi:hypothetical protein
VELLLVSGGGLEEAAPQALQIITQAGAAASPAPFILYPAGPAADGSLMTTALELAVDGANLTFSVERASGSSAPSMAAAARIALSSVRVALQEPLPPRVLKGRVVQQPPEAGVGASSARAVPVPVPGVAVLLVESGRSSAEVAQRVLTSSSGGFSFGVQHGQGYRVVLEAASMRDSGYSAVGGLPGVQVAGDGVSYSFVLEAVAALDPPTGSIASLQSMDGGIGDVVDAEKGGAQAVGVR